MKGRLIKDDEIEDMVQEIFARLMQVEGLERKMSRARGSNRSYLLTMANNMIVDVQRESRVRKAYYSRQKELASEAIDERTPEEIVSARLELEAMKIVIMGMRPNWRQAFILHRFRNMSYEEIALHMGMTLKQVEHFMAQAIRRLRNEKRKRDAAEKKSC